MQFEPESTAEGTGRGDGHVGPARGLMSKKQSELKFEMPTLRHYENVILLSNIEQRPFPIWGRPYAPFLEPNGGFGSLRAAARGRPLATGTPVAPRGPEPRPVPSGASRRQLEACPLQWRVWVARDSDLR